MRNLATIFDKKSYKKFALPYPHNAYPADLLPLWSLSTPHPGQCCFVGGQKWSSRTSTFFFPGGGGEGGVKSGEYLYLPVELYLGTRHGEVHLS